MKGIIKTISVILAMLTLISSVSCTPADAPAESSTPVASTPEATPGFQPDKEPEKPVDLFEKYQSNIVYGTGNNTMIKSANGASPEIATYRATFEVQESGEFEYSLYFSNNIDSSSSGFSTYRDMPTDSYKILYAALRTTSNRMTYSKPTELTFNGSKTKEVAPGETFWCDPVTFSVGKKELLVFEWTVEYTKIPGTIIAKTYYAYKSDKYGDNLPNALTNIAGSAPMPDLIGCTRGNDVRLTFVGDSITMGTGSGEYQNSFWVKQIADRLGAGYSVWNLGLDSARANDVITGKSFKEKMKNTDVLSICFGTNDIGSVFSGTPGQGTAVNGTAVLKSIRDIAAIGEEAGAEIIIFSLPPFNFTGENLSKWNWVNKELKKLAEEKGYKYFDFAAVLSDPANPSRCIYGDHPNKIGCTAVAEAFMKSGLLEVKNK